MRTQLGRANHRLEAGATTPPNGPTATRDSQPAEPDHRDQADPDESDTAHRRGAARAKAVERFGGTRETERAVADGLAWLAAHQQRDGVWDRVRFEERCPDDDRCGGLANFRLGRDMNVGITGLALLAFLGAGYTHQQGEYQQQVTRGFEFLLAQQTPDGSFAAASPFQIYGDALATLAVAEAYTLTRDPVFERPLRQAVAHLAASQQEGGGWDYSARPTGRNDTSITGWVLMALKSAAEAGMPPPRETVWRIIDHFTRATQTDGRVWYADGGIGVDIDQASGERVQRFGPAMTAVGLFAHASIGWRADDPAAERQAALLLADPPSYVRFTRTDPTGLHSEYYWYYGTLAMFHRGGADWAAWNRGLRDCILEYQERPVKRGGAHGHRWGSWPPYGLKWGKWGRMGSRVYSTAINVLTLEIYYRYVPAYLSSHGLIGPRELREYVDAAPPTRLAEWVPRVARFNADVSEPVLLHLSRSGPDAARVEAAVALGLLGSPLARPELLRQVSTAQGEQLARVRAALLRVEKAGGPRTFGRVTQVNAAAHMLLFETAGKAVFYDERVEVLRDGKPVARGRVTRRFSAHEVAAMEIEQGDARSGDAVVVR